MLKKTTDGKLSRKIYEKELRKLQVELCSLQAWVREHKQRNPTPLSQMRSPMAT